MIEQQETCSTAERAGRAGQGAGEGGREAGREGGRVGGREDDRRATHLPISSTSVIVSMLDIKLNRELCCKKNHERAHQRFIGRCVFGSQGGNRSLAFHGHRRRMSGAQVVEQN